MRCICRNCKHFIIDGDEKVCTKHILVVRGRDTCRDFENDEFFNPTKLVAFAIVTIGIVLILSKFL